MPTFFYESKKSRSRTWYGRAIFAIKVTSFIDSYSPRTETVAYAKADPPSITTIFEIDKKRPRYAKLFSMNKHETKHTASIEMTIAYKATHD